MYETLIAIGIGICVSVFRVIKYKKGDKKSKKFRYYNYSKYEVKYNKINKNINEQSKSAF